MTTNLLAFDLGAESGRAILGALDGAKLSLAEKHRFPNPHGRLGQHFHWDLLAQWEQLKTGLRKVAAEKIHLDAIGIDTWGVDFGLLDKSGDLLGNPLMYRDPHTDGILERAFRRVPREKIFAATGIQFLQFNTLFQLLAMRDAGSPLLDVADALLFIPDLFNYLFTGVKANEFSIATTSQFYDPREKTWATGLMESLNIPTHFLQKIVPSGTTLGPITEEVAAECNCDRVPLITPGSHDTASAVAAVPADSSPSSPPAWCYISSGTWSLMGVELDQPIINEKSARYNYTNEGGVAGKIRFLKNIMGMLLVQECRKQWLKQGEEYSYAQLTQMAAGAKPFCAIIDPAHPPFLAPGDMPAKIDQFCRDTKQSPPPDRAHTVRALLESLAFTYRRTLAGLEDIVGHEIKTIHVVGGGSQNELLNQMTADATGRTVIAGPIEATAIGNILVQAMALGVVKNLPDARQVIRQSFPVKTFAPGETSIWNHTYGRYRELCKF